MLCINFDGFELCVYMSNKMRITKIGADAKQKGLIVSLKSVLRVGIITCLIFTVLVVFCVQTKRAISSQTSRYGTYF